MKVSKGDKVSEGDLEIDFTAAISYIKLDDPLIRQPQNMKLVDYIIERETELLFLEIKDPSCPPKSKRPDAQQGIEKSRGEFLKKLTDDACHDSCSEELKGKSLISHELTPKARDSYTYIHLMKRDNKPIIYAFLLGADQLAIDPALLLDFKDRLLKRIRHEADEPWKRQYIADCLVLTEQTWPLAFPEYPLRRLSNI